MMLGIVIHSAITYGAMNYGSAWELKDPSNTNIFFDWLVQFIHKFRMPIFFMVSGFFGSLLFYERSAAKMLRNRIDRVLYPFLVCLFLVVPTIVFGITFSKGAFSGDSNSLINTLPIVFDYATYLPSSTFHLWFLYYLLLFSVSAFALGLLFNRLPKFKNIVNVIFNWVISRSILRLFLFSSITFFLLLLMNRQWVGTSFSLIPYFSTFIFYFLFYLFGWILFKFKHILPSFMKYDLFLTLMGTVIFTMKFLGPNIFSLEIVMAMNAVTVWLFCFGITGLFLRMGSNHSASMRYISDSSYWVYLVHFSLTVFIPGLISNWKIPSSLKFLIVVLSTLTICLLSYHFLVRNTFIGKFLNGRKYPRRIGNLKQIESSKKVNS